MQHGVSASSRSSKHRRRRLFAQPPAPPPLKAGAQRARDGSTAPSQRQERSQHRTLRTDVRARRKRVPSTGRRQPTACERRRPLRAAVRRKGARSRRRAHAPGEPVTSQTGRCNSPNSPQSVGEAVSRRGERCHRSRRTFAPRIKDANPVYAIGASPELQMRRDPRRQLREPSPQRGPSSGGTSPVEYGARTCVATKRKSWDIGGPM